MTITNPAVIFLASLTILLVWFLAYHIGKREGAEKCVGGELAIPNVIVLAISVISAIASLAAMIRISLL